MFSVSRLEKQIHDLRADDEEVSSKINALDATRTRTQLERDHNDTLAELAKLENEKD